MQIRGRLRVLAVAVATLAAVTTIMMPSYVQLITRPDFEVVTECRSCAQISNVSVTINNYGTPAHDVEIIIASSGVTNITKVEVQPPILEISYEIENVFYKAQNLTFVRSKLSRMNMHLTVRFELSVDATHEPVSFVLITSDETETIEIGETARYLIFLRNIVRVGLRLYPLLMVILIFVVVYLFLSE